MPLGKKDGPTSRVNMVLTIITRTQYVQHYSNVMVMTLGNNLPQLGLRVISHRFLISDQMCNLAALTVYRFDPTRL